MHMRVHGPKCIICICTSKPTQARVLGLPSLASVLAPVLTGLLVLTSYTWGAVHSPVLTGSFSPSLGGLGAVARLWSLPATGVPCITMSSSDCDVTGDVAGDVACSWQNVAWI